MMFVDVSAEMENGQREQMLLDEEQNVEDAARATIPLAEWMDRFKLIMADRHPNEWIERLFVVHEALPVSQEWKRVDQHGRIWEQLGTLPELRQGRTGVDAAFSYSLGFQFSRGW